THDGPMASAAQAARVAVPLGARPRAWRWRSLFGLASGLCGRATMVVGLGLAWGVPALASAAPSTPAFEDPEPFVSNDGSIQLTWSGELGDYEVELTTADGTARVVYRGRMPSAHLSG